MAKVNKKGIQSTILFIQAIVVSLLAGLYFVMTNVSVAFFVLSAMTATLYLVMYILMYSTAIKLRITRPDLPRSYKIPGGVPGMCAVAGLGLAGVLFSLLVGFFPPTNLPVGNPVLYGGIGGRRSGTLRGHAPGDQRLEETRMEAGYRIVKIPGTLEFPICKRPRCFLQNFKEEFSCRYT